MRFACYTNKERNAVTSHMFLQHLSKTHTQSNDLNTTCPDHTCIIKGCMKYNRNSEDMVPISLQNMIYDTVGDADMFNGEQKRVDPPIKFYYNKPFMMNSNDRIEEKLANGTPCRGLYLKLRHGQSFKKEIWEGYVINTIYADQIEYMICARERKKDTDPFEYFKIEPEEKSVKITFPTLGNYKVKGIHMTQFGINDNIATTVHKLQGVSLDNLIIHSWNYAIKNWVYVVLSRVKTLKGLVLCKPLDIDRDYSCDQKLLDWENNLRIEKEKKLFELRGELEQYEEEEREFG